MLSCYHTGIVVVTVVGDVLDSFYRTGIVVVTVVGDVLDSFYHTGIVVVTVVGDVLDSDHQKRSFQLCNSMNHLQLYRGGGGAKQTRSEMLIKIDLAPTTGDNLGIFYLHLEYGNFIIAVVWSSLVGRQ